MSTRTVHVIMEEIDGTNTNTTADGVYGHYDREGNLMFDSTITSGHDQWPKGVVFGPPEAPSCISDLRRLANQFKRIGVQTDFELMVFAFKKIGVQHVIGPTAAYGPKEEPGIDGCYQRKGYKSVKMITLEEGKGYSAFRTEFWFDKDGKYLTHACLE